MNNEEARTALDIIYGAVQTASHNLERYKSENTNWNAEYKTAQIAAIKVLGTAAGVDLSTWTGAD
jgi:hypothetical protein